MSDKNRQFNILKIIFHVFMCDVSCWSWYVFFLFFFFFPLFHFGCCFCLGLSSMRAYSLFAYSFVFRLHMPWTENQHKHTYANNVHCTFWICTLFNIWYLALNGCARAQIQIVQQIIPSRWHLAFGHFLYTWFDTTECIQQCALPSAQCSLLTMPQSCDPIILRVQEIYDWNLI